MIITSQRLKPFWLFLPLCLLFTACNPARTVTVNGAQCIQPKLTTIPTKMPLWDEDRGVGDMRAVIPPKEPIPSWMVAQLNEEQLKELPKVAPFDMVMDDSIIWVVDYENTIFQYDTSTQHFRVYRFDGQVPALSVDDMLLTKDHQVWILGTRLSKDRQYPILMRYNPQKDTFEDVVDADGLLLPIDGSYVTYRGVDKLVKESANGELVFIFRRTIYSYNPLTNKAKIVLQDPNLKIASIETDPRGAIWFTVLKDDALWKLDPDTKELQSFKLPTLPLGPMRLDVGGPYYRDGYSLYLDSQYRLWIPAWGYFDTTAKELTWISLKPDPLFVNLYDSDFTYIWDDPDTLQAQDGSIWFGDNLGVLHYDMKTQSTCWVSPIFGRVAQAQDGSIWIMVYNQLYKYIP